MFLVLKIITFELVAGISGDYDKNTCDRPSTCQKKVLTFKKGLRDKIQNSLCFILMKRWPKSAAAQT